MDRLLEENLSRIRNRRAWTGVVLFLAYLVSLVFGNTITPGSLLIFPAAGLGLALLFFEGLSLWPAVYLGVLVAGAVLGWPFASLVLLPVAYTLEAAVGAFLLKRAGVDPLFRSKSSVFWLFGTIALVALLVPLAEQGIELAGVAS